MDRSTSPLTKHGQMLEIQARLAQKFREKSGNELSGFTRSEKTATNGKGDIPEACKDFTTEYEKFKVDASTDFDKAKKEYFGKRNKGETTIEEDIEFLRLESAENARLNKMKTDEDWHAAPSDSEAREDSLFVHESIVGPSYEEDHSDNDLDKAVAGVKRRKRSLRADNDDDQAASPRKRGKKTEAKSKDPAKAKPKKRKEQKTQGPRMTNIDSVFHSDLFADAAKASTMASQPTFDKSTSRKDAMAQLLSSAPQDDLRAVRDDAKAIDNATKAFPVQAVKPAEEGQWSLKGMRSTLKSYQLLGVAFMRKREMADNQPRGGILADEMGLGKTIEMLANIVSSRPTSKSKLRTTLIVASPALVEQWMNEIRKHVFTSRENKEHGLGQVLQYRAGFHIGSSDLTSLLEQADIVLTTYHEVSKSYPKAIVPAHLVTSQQKDAWWQEYFAKERGILHKIKFLRVCLDEASAIKNHKAHVSMACRALNARHYWAITGTPILNTTKEFYPYFKFLREPHTGSYRIFKDNCCTPGDPDGKDRLSVFLNKFMLRRTHADTLFNSRLLDLPPVSVQTCFLEFNDIEKHIYEIVKKRCVQRINQISKQGHLEASQCHIWTMVLRLRMLCTHPILIGGTIMDLLEREDLVRLERLCDNEDEATDEGKSLLLHLRDVLKNNAHTQELELGTARAVIEEHENLTNTGGNHGVNFRFRRFLNVLKESGRHNEILERTICGSCRQPPHTPYITSCCHIYCLACLKDLQHSAARKGQDHSRCAECGEAFMSSEPCDALTEFEADAQSASDATVPTRKPINGKRNDFDDWMNVKGEVLSSAKTRAVKAQIMNWFEEDDKQKIIIYTQFIGMIKILSRVAQSEGWGICTYHGKMAHDARSKSIADFGDDPSKKLLLASLKCGGMGLNLTMANRVICLDGWWNLSIEQQAFARVYRINQQRSTSMTRFIIKNSVDEAIHDLKITKQESIDEVMNAPKKNLPINELLRLFGEHIEQDEEGHPFIFAENQDAAADHMRLAEDDVENEEGFMGNEA